ncbi:MAG: type II secretion system GspH family protein [Phycisphaerales bacterium]|nr:type II secretion system GspH family protein [Phycisphaerales bacterium]
MARQITISQVSPHRPSRRRAGFTLIELMIVAAVIIVLAGITLAVGISAKHGAGIRKTKETLQALDGIMKDYLAAGNPEPVASPPAPVNNPDQTVWVQALRTSPDLANKLAGFTTKMTNNGYLTILDAFGNAIGYVPSKSTGNTVTTPGYFQSAGPDGLFGDSNGHNGADDIFSMDPQ